MDKKLDNMFRRGIGRSLWLAALVLIALQGCSTIDDNTGKCFPQTRLKLEYTYNLSGNDLLAEQVETIDLYIYDKNDGSLVSVKSFARAELLKNDFTINLNWLRQGQYDIVVFGNLNTEYYRSYDHNAISSLRLMMICSDGNGTMTRNPSSFFYGLVTIDTASESERTVMMVKDTHDINITVRNSNVPTRASGEGLPDLTVSIAVRNGTLKSDNSIAEEDPRLMTHISDNAFPQYATELRTSLRVGRLFETDGSKVVIKEKETGRVLSTDNLTEKIVKLLTEDENYDGMNPNEYLDRMDSYDLLYIVEMKYGVLVTTLITINEWNVIKNPVGGV